MSDEDGALPPVKSIARAADVLRILAKFPAGSSLSQVAKAGMLGKATAHRILSALIDEGFAYQEKGTRSYQLGSGLVELCRIARRRDASTLAVPVLEQLAAETEDTAYVHVQEGLRSVCVGRLQGAFPIKTLTLDIGQTRPLGVGSGSIALLAFLPDPEIEEAIEANRRWLDAFASFGPDVVRSLVKQAKAQGFSYINGQMTPNISAIGVPVMSKAGRPLASLSITAISERVSGARIQWLASTLQREAKFLAAQLDGLREG